MPAQYGARPAPALSSFAASPPFMPSYALTAALNAAIASLTLRSSRLTRVILTFDSGPHWVCTVRLRPFLLRSTIARWRSVQTQCRSEEHTSELQSQSNLVCRLLLEKKKQK